MKVLFLDIDGVLNGSDWFHKNHEARLKHRVEYGNGAEFAKDFMHPMGHLDPLSISFLNKIVEETGCKIVISSTWRKFSTLSEIRGFLSQKGFKHPLSIIDKTEDFNIGYARGLEIHNWLNECKDKVDSFVILDDDVDMHHLLPWQVLTDGIEGLNEKTMSVAIRILNGEIQELKDMRKFGDKEREGEAWEYNKK